MNALRPLLIALAVASALGCEEEVPVPYEIRVEAKDDRDRPLSSVQVRMGDYVGKTDKDGSMLAAIHGTDGMPIDFEIECPEGFRLLDAPRRISLRRIHQIGTTEFAPIIVGVSCTPLMRKAVILMHLGEHGANLPYYVNNTPGGRTDESGTAHILLEDIASRRYRVEIDTSSDPDIRPLNPSQNFVIPDKDAFLSYELLMSKDEEKKPVRRTRRRRRPRGPSGPSRL